MRAFQPGTHCQRRMPQDNFRKVIRVTLCPLTVNHVDLMMSEICSYSSRGRKADITGRGITVTRIIASRPATRTRRNSIGSKPVNHGMSIRFPLFTQLGKAGKTDQVSKVSEPGKRCRQI
jgi:hypothetical protein